MTTYQVNSAKVQEVSVDTTNLTNGRYTLTIKYLENNKYKESSESVKVVLEDYIPTINRIRIKTVNHSNILFFVPETIDENDIYSYTVSQLVFKPLLEFYIAYYSPIFGAVRYYRQTEETMFIQWNEHEDVDIAEMVACFGINFTPNQQNYKAFYWEGNREEINNSTVTTYGVEALEKINELVMNAPYHPDSEEVWIEIGSRLGRIY